MCLVYIRLRQAAEKANAARAKATKDYRKTTSTNPKDKNPSLNGEHADDFNIQDLTLAAIFNEKSSFLECYQELVKHRPGMGFILVLLMGFFGGLMVSFSILFGSI